METVFVKTRWAYQSYTDFWAMVALAGYSTCYVDEVDVEAEKVYIVNPLNGEWEPMLAHRLVNEGRTRRAMLVSWTIEPPVKSDYLPNLRRTVDEGLVDWIWMGYRNLAQAAAHPRIRFVPVGSMAGLGDLSACACLRAYPPDCVRTRTGRHRQAQAGTRTGRQPSLPWPTSPRACGRSGRSLRKKRDGMLDLSRQSMI
jgi:hypothetical protein